MFRTAGNPLVKILEAFIAHPPWDKSESVLAVAVKVQDAADESQSDFYYAELSEEYGTGNHAGKKQWEITLETLKKVGWEHGKNIGNETLKSLVGTETVAWIKAREYDMNGETKVAYEPRGLGGKSFGPKKMSDADAKAKLRAMFGAEAPSEEAAEKVEEKQAAPEAAADSSDNPFG